MFFQTVLIKITLLALTDPLPSQRLPSILLVIFRTRKKELLAAQKTFQLIISYNTGRGKGGRAEMIFRIITIIYCSQKHSWRSKASASDEGGGNKYMKC